MPSPTGSAFVVRALQAIIAAGLLAIVGKTNRRGRRGHPPCGRCSPATKRYNGMGQVTRVAPVMGAPHRAVGQPLGEEVSNIP
jgi:hypothetical protein